MIRHLTSMVGEDAEYVYQAVSIKVLARFDHFRGESKFSTWLLRICSNAALNHLRDFKASRVTNFSSISDSGEFFEKMQRAPDDPCPMDDVESAVNLEKWADTMKSVLSDMEISLLRSVSADLSYDELESILGIKAATLRSHVFRARGKLIEHVLRKMPEVAGGPQEIGRALQKAVSEGPPRGLTPDEANLLRSEGANVEGRRRACLKLCGFLQIRSMPV